MKDNQFYPTPWELAARKRKTMTEKIEDICRDLERQGNFAASTVGEALRQLTDFDSENKEELLIAAVTLEELKDWAESTAKQVREIAK